MKMKPQQPKTYAISKCSVKREVHSDTSLPQETRETSRKQPNFITKATRKIRKELQS